MLLVLKKNAESMLFSQPLSAAKGSLSCCSPQRPPAPWASHPGTGLLHAGARGSCLWGVGRDSLSGTIGGRLKPEFMAGS